MSICSKGNTYPLLVRMQTSMAIIKVNVEGPQKVMNAIPQVAAMLLLSIDLNNA